MGTEGAYADLGFGAMFILTMQEALGNFGAIPADSITSEYTYIIFIVEWYIMVVFMFIIFTNFLIASVGDSYQIVVEQKSTAFAMQQLDYIVTQWKIEGKGDNEGFVLFVS